MLLIVAAVFYSPKTNGHDKKACSPDIFKLHLFIGLMRQDNNRKKEEI